MSKRDDGQNSKAKRQVIMATLDSLTGLKYKDMTKAQQEDFITVLGQLADVMNANGKVKPVRNKP